MSFKAKNKLLFIAKSLMISSTIVYSLAITSLAGHKNYYLKTTVDYGGFGLLHEVVTDDGNGGGGTNDEYAEESLGYNYSKIKHYGNVCNKPYDTNKTTHLTVNFNEKRDTPEDRVNQYKDLEGVSDDTLVFSFPGLKGKSYKATSNDYARASLVGDNLVTGLNQAILFIRNNSKSELVSKHSLHLMLGKLCYTSELTNKETKFEITVGNPSTTFILSSVSSKTKNIQKELIPLNGLDYSDYVKITVKDGPYKDNYSYFPWRMKKGYYPNDAMANYVGESYTKDAKGADNEYLSWGQLIVQAMLINDVKGASEQDYASDVQTIIGQGLGSDLTATISSVRNLLGLSSMSELVLNMGARPANYHLGVMSKDMHNIALTIYTLNLTISLTFVGFMIVKMIHQKMVATTNVIAKTTLMEGIKDLAFVAVMLGFFAPLFEVLLELNYLIVRTFSYSSEFMASFSALGQKTLSMESMAGFMVSSMFLSIDMYINFVYLVRAITVSFLFAVAPIIIVSYLWSPTQKNMVFGFMRELVGNIFMQSFHAITMTFFCAYNMSNMSTLEAIASAYCFIPITQLFRQLVLGNSGGFSEKAGGKLAGQISTMTMGMQKSAMQAKQSKEMFTAQAKYQADVAKSEKNSGIISSVGQVGATIGTSVLTGMATGSVVPGLGTVAGAIAGLGAGIGASFLGKSVSQNGVEKAMGELGSVQSLHADQTLGMGLAELGVGLGVSSFDSAGDRMVASGLSTIQSGASMKGQAESRMGEGGQYTGEAFGHAVEGRNMSQMITTVGYGVNKAVDHKLSQATKKDRMVEDMELRDQATKEFEAKHADRLKAERQALRTRNKEEELQDMKDNRDLHVEMGSMKMSIDVDAKLDHRDKNLEKMDRLSRAEMADKTRNQLAYNSEDKESLELLEYQKANISNRAKLKDLQNNPAVHEAMGVAQDRIRDAVQNEVLKNPSSMKIENGVLNNQLNREIYNRDNVVNSREVREHDYNRYSNSQRTQSDYEKRNANLIKEQGYNKYAQQQEYKDRYEQDNAHRIKEQGYNKYVQQQEYKDRYEQDNAYRIKEQGYNKYAQQQEYKDRYEKNNANRIKEQGYSRYVQQQEYKDRYIEETKNKGNDSQE